MNTRKLGGEGLEVSAVGLGCMGMSWAYGPSDESESMQVFHRALELGVNFWDTAEVYGPFANEELLGRVLKNVRREDVVVATKFGFRFSPSGEIQGADGSPAHVKQTVDGSLRRLGIDCIDLYYQHRLDPKTPIEDTVGAMSELVTAGKVRYLGLSEVGPGIIRRAHAVHPISAVQSEYSLWERGVEAKVLPTLRDLGIGLVPYSPIGRGFLSGRIRSVDDLEKTDWRRNQPRFQGDNFTRNMRFVDEVKRVAAEHGATPAQVAIAWLLRVGDDVVPIPGTRHVEYLEEDVGAVNLDLPDTAWSAIEEILGEFATAGARYQPEAMQMIDTTE